MSGVIDSIERAQLKRVPVFQAGDRVRVHFQVVEGTRRRTQVFEGIVIKRQGSGARETFTVRKQSFGVGVERTFPLHSPKIEKIDVASRGDVRRAKLYYLRERVGRGARVRERRWTVVEEVIQPGLVEEGAMPEDDAPRPGEEELAEATAAEEAAAAAEAAAAEGAAAEDAPAAEGAAVEAAPADEDAADAPAEEPAGEQPVADESPAEEAAVEEAAADTAEAPPAEEAAVEEAAADEAADEPAADEPDEQPKS